MESGVKHAAIAMGVLLVASPGAAEPAKPNPSFSDLVGTWCSGDTKYVFKQAILPEYPGSTRMVAGAMTLSVVSLNRGQSTVLVDTVTVDGPIIRLAWLDYRHAHTDFELLQNGMLVQLPAGQTGRVEFRRC
jgi:hypothetical protein